MPAPACLRRWSLILALVLVPGFAAAAEPAGAEVRPAAGVKKKKKPRKVRPAAGPGKKSPVRPVARPATKPLAAKPLKSVKHLAKPAHNPKRAEKKPQVAASAGERWQDLQQTATPKALIRSAEAFEQDFPGSEYSPALQDILAGAQQAMRAQQAAKLSSDTLAEAGGNAAYRQALGKAARGDAEAALQIARMYGEGSHGLPASARRHEQWLQVAAELGNAAASWQLAKRFNRAGLLGEAAKYETRAVELGFQPPPRLPTKGRNI